MRKTGLLLISLLFCASCADKHDHKGQTPLVEVDGNFLYKEDLQAVLPAGLSKDDSLLFAEHYVRSLAEVLHKSQMTVKTALAVLEKQELIFRKRRDPRTRNSRLLRKEQRTV